MSLPLPPQSSKPETKKSQSSKIVFNDHGQSEKVRANCLPTASWIAFSYVGSVPSPTPKSLRICVFNLRRREGVGTITVGHQQIRTWGRKCELFFPLNTWLKWKPPSVIFKSEKYSALVNDHICTRIFSKMLKAPCQEAA